VPWKDVRVRGGEHAEIEAPAQTKLILKDSRTRPIRTPVDQLVLPSCCKLRLRHNSLVPMQLRCSFCGACSCELLHSLPLRHSLFFFILCLPPKSRPRVGPFLGFELQRSIESPTLSACDVAARVRGRIYMQSSLRSNKGRVQALHRHRTRTALLISLFLFLFFFFKYLQL
jgi:hypothetical protein